MGIFDGLMTADFKALHTGLIDELIASGNCGVEHQIIYGETKWIDCINCFWDAAGQKSTNKYFPGGPIEFHTGICPYCHGRGRIQNETTDILIAAVNFDYNTWVGWNGTSARTRYPDGGAQTMSKMDTITKIQRAQEIILNTDIQKYTHHRMTRDGEPTPCGLGNDAYIFTIWKHMQ